MKTKAKLLAIVFVVLVFVACTNHQEILESRGIMDDHEVKNIEKMAGFQGHVAGAYFLGSGGILGSIKSGNQIEFSWSPFQGEAVVSSFPITMFRTRIFNKQRAPVVRFLFNEEWLKSRAHQNWKSIRNVNKLIEVSRLEEIEVLISEADLEKEPLLPKSAKTARTAPKEKTYIAQVTYYLNFDTAYTGAPPTYTPYVGQESFEILESQRSASGLPYLNKWELPASTVIKFQRNNGENCELLVPITEKLDPDNKRWVPAARDAAIRCPSSKCLSFVNAYVERQGQSDVFTVFAAPTKEEVEEMIKNGGAKI